MGHADKESYVLNPISTAPLRILVVEDDEGIRLGLSDLVSEFGEVEAASVLEEGKAALAHARFDLVIADVRLGGRRDAGREMVKAARANLAAVAVMSGLQREEIRDALGDSVPDAVITKPFQVDEVLKLVEGFARVKTIALAEAGARCDSWITERPGVEVCANGRNWIRLAKGSPLTGDGGEFIYVVEGAVAGGNAIRGGGDCLFLSRNQVITAKDRMIGVRIRTA